MGAGSHSISIVKHLVIALVVLPLYCMGFIGGSGGGVTSISSDLKLRSLSVSGLKAESGDGGGAQVSAKELSKGFAHPPSVFTVDKDIARILPHRYPFALVDKVKLRVVYTSHRAVCLICTDLKFSRGGVGVHICSSIAVVQGGGTYIYIYIYIYIRVRCSPFDARRNHFSLGVYLIKLLLSLMKAFRKSTTSEV